MTLSELIAAVGDDHVEFQNLMQGDLELNVGKRDGRITFHTGIDKVQDLMHGGKRFVGLVVWLPKDRMPELSKENEDEQICICGHSLSTHTPCCVSACGCDEFTAKNKEREPINAQGRYPLCMPIIGDLSARCERCGGYAGYNRPCPSIPPEKRWGDDYGEWIIVKIMDRTEKSVRIASADARINGGSYISSCLVEALPGDTWAVYRVPEQSVFGVLEKAVLLHRLR